MKEIVSGKRVTAPPVIVSKMTRVTPEMAEDWLKHNRANRPLRKSHVRWLTKIIVSGEWVPSHQGIAFAADGALLDGQHRLRAIIASGKAVQIMVTTGLSESAFQGMDLGARRSVSDVLGLDKRAADAISFLARLFEPSPTIGQVESLYAAIGTKAETLIAHCGTTKRGLTSSPVKAAFVLRMATDQRREMWYLDKYRNLAHMEFHQLTPAINSVVKRLVDPNETLRGGRMTPLDSFLRMWRALAPDAAQSILIKNQDYIVAETRDAVRRAAPGIFE